MEQNTKSLFSSFLQIQGKLADIPKKGTKRKMETPLKQTTLPEIMKSSSKVKTLDLSVSTPETELLTIVDPEPCNDEEHEDLLINEDWQIKQKNDLISTVYNHWQIFKQEFSSIAVVQSDSDAPLASKLDTTLKLFSPKIIKPEHLSLFIPIYTKKNELRFLPGMTCKICYSSTSTATPRPNKNKKNEQNLTEMADFDYLINLGNLETHLQLRYTCLIMSLALQHNIDQIIFKNMPSVFYPYISSEMVDKELMPTLLYPFKRFVNL